MIVVVLGEGLPVVKYAHMRANAYDRHYGGSGGRKACDACQPYGPHACVGHCKCHVLRWSRVRAHPTAFSALAGTTTNAQLAIRTMFPPEAKADASIWVVANGPTKIVDVVAESDLLRSH